MARTPQREFLGAVLSGDVPTAEVLGRLLNARVAEDLHLEFKDGRWVDKASTDGDRGDPAARVRKYLAGFANADGGVLVIGVGEPAAKGEPRGIAPCMRWRTADEAERWVATTALALRPYLSPPPRIHAIRVDGGFVLVVAQPRTSGMVVCEEVSRPVHYLRLHDNTVPAPSYLVEDLLLGRRRGIDVGLVGEVHCRARPSHGNPVTPRWLWDTEFRISIENRGLGFVNSPHLGVCFSADSFSGSMQVPSEVERAVVPDCAGGRRAHWLFLEAAGGRLGADLAPLGRFYTHLPWRPNFETADGVWLWGFAACVVARDVAPVWFQVEVTVDPTAGRAEMGGGARNGTSPIRARRADDFRPELYIARVGERAPIEP